MSATKTGNFVKALKTNEAEIVALYKSNYEISKMCREDGDLKSKRTVKHVVIWGGGVGNCAGDAFSLLLQTHRESLESVTFFPRSSKRILIQPHYFNRRDASPHQENDPMCFPLLTELSCSIWVGVKPLLWGYDLPMLRRFNLLYNNTDKFAPAAMDVATISESTKAILSDSPLLESIRLYSADNGQADETKPERWPIDYSLVATLFTPVKLSWSTYRLLLLASKTWDEENKKDSEENVKSERPAMLGKLPKEVLEHIVTFLYRDWHLVESTKHSSEKS